MRKSRIAVLLAVFALAAALCPGVALAMEGGLQSEVVQAQDSSLPENLDNQGYQVRLDGNEADWLVFYVDGKDGTYSPRAELFYQDELVDPKLYELKWQISYWMEDQEVFQDASLPLKLLNADPEGEYTGIGDSYRVVAVPAEGSSLKGESRPTEANVADKYTFDFFGKTIKLEGGYENERLVPGMFQGFEADTHEAKCFRVFESAVNSKGAEIDPRYYDVEYYNRKPGPYDPSKEGWADGLRVEENPLGGFPTKAGTYFAVIKAKAPYFGRALVDFDLIDNYLPSQTDIHLDGEGGDLFSDGTAQFKVNAESTLGEEGVDWNVVVAVGIQGTFDDETRTFNPAFNKGEYVYDAASKTITLNGGKIMKSAGVEGELPIVVRAWIADKDGNVLCEDIRWILCRPTRADYDREWDRGLLPGWDGEVRNAYSVYVENSAHPDGAELEYAVSAVDIVRQDAREGGGDVIKLEKSGGGWRYEALEYGEATLKVTYRDLEGAAQSYNFNVYVSEDVYDIQVSAEGDVRRVHPGETVTLTAEAHHHSVNDDDAPLDGATYRWALEEGSEFASIAQDANDPRKAVVTFAALHDGQDEIWEDVKACVRLYDGVDEGGNPNECAYGDIWFNLDQCSPRDHEWSAPTYVWAHDMSSVSASRTCSNCDLVESEVAKVSATTTPATYTTEGKTVYTATFANPAFKTQTKTVSIAKLEKANQSLKVTASAKTLKAKKLKKKAQTVSLLKVVGAQGAVSYKIASANAKAKKALKLNAANGKIAVKKGTKKGAYSMKVTVVAAGNEQYNAASQTVTVKVKVK